MYKKVTLISFSIEPVLRFQYVFFCFWQMLNLQKSPPLPSAKNLLHGYTHNNMHISKDGAIADGGFFVLSYGKFLLQSRLSDSVEQYNEPPRYRLRRHFAKSIFCGSYLLDGYPVRRRFSSYKPSGTPLKK